GQHGLVPHAAILLRTGSIPMTSSGKVQRFACRDAFLNNALDEVGRWNDDSESTKPNITCADDPVNCRREIESFVVEQVARALACPPSAVDVARPLMTLGIDSLTAADIKTRIESQFDLRIPLSCFFEEKASVRTLVEILVGQPTVAQAPLLDHEDLNEW